MREKKDVRGNYPELEEAAVGPADHARGPTLSRRGEERLFEAIANYTYDWESWMGLDGRPRWINPAVERVTGYTVAECLAMADYPLPIIHEEDRASIASHLRNAAAGQSGNDIAFRLLQKGGQLRWAAVSWQTLYDDAGRSLGYRTSIRDISSRKQAEEALRHAHREAERASRAKSRFLAAASHDLRQPLQAINMFVAALKVSAGADESGEIIASIQESLRATDELLDALLDVSRLDAGVLQPRLRPVAVADLVDRMETEFASQAARKGITLRTVTSSRVVRTDPTLLERVLRNLVSNAVRYTESGRILIGCRRRGRNLRLEVWDTGIGIPADKLGAVFEEFYQLGNPERDRTHGLGLGLAIVDRVSSLLGYRIDVRSIPGQGSMFAIELPNDPQLVMPAPAPAPAGDTPDAGALAGRLIVAIDDEPMQRRAMRELFGRWGCEVVDGASAAEALARLVELQRPPDAIVADYRLRKEMNGVQAIKTLRSGLGRTIPGVILTGDTEPARLREAEASGFELLHKPVDTERLFAVLARMATGRRAAPATGSASTGSSA